MTLSQQQADWAQRRSPSAGLPGRAQVRFQDYRDVPEGGFDAVSSIGLTEHIGRANYPAYFPSSAASSVPGAGCSTTASPAPTRSRRRCTASGFINRYVFPDGELVPISRIIGVMEDERLEVRHEENLREHYALTLRDWCRNLDESWDEAVAEVGEGKARVWRLYMAASRLGFERNMIQLHQVLATNTSDSGDAGVPLRPWF